MRRSFLRSSRSRPIQTCSICNSVETYFLYERYGHSLFRCRRCDHVQVSPIPSEATLQAHYQSGFGASEFASDPAAIRAFAEASDGDFPAKVIGAMALDRKAAILDVGCSFGYDLYALKHRLGFPNVHGWELSETAARVARETLGLSVFTRREEIADARLRFDFIYLKHNLEHHRDPIATLKTLQELLKPGGKILVGVPNRKSFNGLFGKRWEWVTPPTHLHYFSRRSLQSALHSAGLSSGPVTSRRGHGLSFLKHALFFSPGISRVAQRYLGSPYVPESARWVGLRRGVESFLSSSAKFTGLISGPVKRAFLLGEELWILTA